MKTLLLILLLLVVPFPQVLAHEDVTQSPRSTECREILSDHFYIVEMYQHGIAVSRMRQKAINSHEALGDEHFNTIMKLIDESENAVHEDKLLEWLNVYWAKCVDVI